MIENNKLPSVLPIEGDEYLITAAMRGAKPKYGTQLFTYKGKKYQGCQLHGDFLGYTFHFKGEKLNDWHSEAVITLRFNEDDEHNAAAWAEAITDKIGHPLRRNGKPFIY